MAIKPQITDNISPEDKRLLEAAAYKIFPFSYQWERKEFLQGNPNIINLFLERCSLDQVNAILHLLPPINNDQLAIILYKHLELGKKRLAALEALNAALQKSRDAGTLKPIKKDTLKEIINHL